ncbi:MAG: hypothetical protein A3F73_07510 [Gallionellales bacterium RIFCSPLOWO2_12_FULL_59_22]|nr:MAG: hypothetical protein A2Z65_00185 [Gallionellales bacterium RIFCSPLOWO2_02_58_13]OGT13182.1 MAG: hypothetical protein A3F73_07510 [Gallionellales bacterium RIFCSPLOWO2_12_FULL_59_22]
MRIKSRWFKEGRSHTPEELAGAVSFVVWRIAANALKNTRKAHFGVEVGKQYFAFLNEFLVFLIQVADRIVYRRLPPDDRAMFTGILANRVAETLAENRSRLLGGTPEDAKQQFIDLLNQRADGYAEFDYDEDGPSFNFTRYLGYSMNQIMDEHDSRWIVDQMMSIEAPQAVEMVGKTLRDLLETGPRQPRRRAVTAD